MNLWGIHLKRLEPRSRVTRHDFAIGPVCEGGVHQRNSKLYYCIHCKWSFLVTGTKISALGENGAWLDTDESQRRLATFERGPCHVMEAFVSAATLDGGRVRPNIKGRPDLKRDHLIVPELPARSDRRKRVLRVVARMISGGPHITQGGVVDAQRRSFIAAQK
jgi:hypothetical protein